MEIILAIFAKFAAHPITTGLGIATIALGFWAGAEHLDIAYKTSQIATLNNTIDSDKIAIINWQTKFGQLQVAANDQNAQISKLEEKDAELEKRITSSNITIDNYEKELQEDAKTIAAQNLPKDCSAALNILVNNTKTTVNKLKIERPIR